MRAFVMVCLFAGSLFAKELHGVTLDDSVTVAGKQLRLNGAGTRTKFMVKVYVGGLYLEQPTHDPAKAIVLDGVKRIELVMLRDLSKKKIVDAIRDGFEKVGKDKALAKELTQFEGAFGDLKKGERLTLTFSPSSGTTVGSTTVPGREFAEALLAVWLGNSPADADLKRAMLGL
jgi:hypothetical protein